MQLPQLLTKFGLTLPRLEAILGQHIKLSNLRLVRRVPPEWEAILARELGVPAVIGSGFSGIADALVAYDAKQEALTIAPVLPELADEGQKIAGSPTSASGLRGLKIIGHANITASIGTDTPHAHAKKQFLNNGNKDAPNRPKKTVSAPLDENLQFGPVVAVVEAKGFGFVRKLATNREVFWNIRQLDGKLPAVNDWLLFSDQPSRRPGQEGKEEVTWARPLSHDVSLLRRMLARAEASTLHLLLNAELDEGCRKALLNEFFDRMKPATSAETLATLTHAIEFAKQKGITGDEQWLDKLIANSEPAFAWQLWLRYDSPLIVWPDVAERVIKLLETTHEVATDWWVGSRGEGLPGLYLAYVATAGLGSLLKAWQDLKIALGVGQATVYHEMLRQWLAALGPVESADSYVLFSSVVRTTAGDKASLEQELAALLAPAARLDVWLGGEKLAFPQAAAVARFEGLPVADQDKVAAHLPAGDLLALGQFITAEHAAATQQRARQALDDDVLNRFAALGLDLESNRETIHEIAWGSPGAWHVGQGPEAVAVALAALGERTAGPAYLVVGHNVLDFDAPILAEQGVTLPADCLWDTLLVEMALSPDRPTYALQTDHAAAADAELALRLFGNQVLRLGQLAEARWEALRPLFAAPVLGLLVDFRRTCAAGWLQPGDLDREAAECLRPRPAPSALRRQVQEWLAAAPGGAVLVAPREVWAEAFLHSPVRFWADENTALDYRELQPAAALQRAGNYPTEQVLLDGFFELCRREGWPALPANMAPALRARLRAAEIDLAECLAPLPERLGAEAAHWCLTAEQLCTIGPAWPEPGPTLAVVEPDLITLGNRRELRRLGADEVRNNAATDTEWLKFSGGQSFLGLTPAQARQLGADPPPGYDNFWLEKHQYGQYRLWAGFGWEQIMAGLAAPGQPVAYLDGTARDYPAGQLRSAAAPAQRLQRQLGVVPLNPETIYRSRYWLLQAALVRGLAERGSRPAPLVLLVQRPEEVGPLEKYFGREGLGF